MHRAKFLEWIEVIGMSGFKDFLCVCGGRVGDSL